MSWTRDQLSLSLSLLRARSLSLSLSRSLALSLSLSLSQTNTYTPVCYADLSASYVKKNEAHHRILRVRTGTKPLYSASGPSCVTIVTKACLAPWYCSFILGGHPGVRRQSAAARRQVEAGAERGSRCARTLSHTRILLGAAPAHKSQPEPHAETEADTQNSSSHGHSPHAVQRHTSQT